jgi:transposase-like protein
MQDVVEIGRVAQDELRQDLSTLFRGAIRLTLEMVLEEELKAMVGARRFERVGSRKDHRNGTYLRRLLTSMGQIEVTVPRRGQGAPADVIGRYQRRPSGATDATSTCHYSRHRRPPRQLSRSTEELRLPFYTEIGT